MKTILTLLISIICFTPAYAQNSAKADSLAILNKLRLQTNDNGMKVLGTWGLLNIVGGTIQCFTAKSTEWKAFGGMNIVWGVVNGGIAGMALASEKKELNKQLSNTGMLKSYESTKRLYLINAGLDFAYIGAGVFMTEHSKTIGSYRYELRGFGKSFTMQGLFLLVFDNTMFIQHERYNSKWYSLLQGVCFTGNSVGFNYIF